MSKIRRTEYEDSRRLELMRSLSRKRVVSEIISELSREEKLDLLSTVDNHLKNPSAETRETLAKKLNQIFQSSLFSLEALSHFWEVAKANVPAIEQALIIKAIDDNAKLQGDKNES